MLDFIDLNAPFTLESSETLKDVRVAYQTFGKLNTAKSNVVFVSHALTGSTKADEWWSGLIGEGKLLDPAKHFIICPNALGSCYGSTGPGSINPETNEPYNEHFPTITIRDIARAYSLVLDALRIETIELGIGGSMGAMVLLELATLTPTRFNNLVLAATGITHSAWRLAFSTTVRRTISAFAAQATDKENALQEGMRIARQFAMISYRSQQEFDARFGRERLSNDPAEYYTATNLFEVESYLEHQGQKIVDRFSPYSYITLTRAMELFDLERGRSSVASSLLSQVTARTLVIGISSDLLYPEEEVRGLAQSFSGATYQTLISPYGHDSFLVDSEQMHQIIKEFWNKENWNKQKLRKEKKLAGKALAGAE